MEGGGALGWGADHLMSKPSVKSNTANAAFHVGHMMEYIQADIWVRFQRMCGHEVHFVCADDAHGAPIMIAAENAGKSPQEFVARIAAGRKQYLDGFHIGFDHWHSTDSPENVELSQDIYRHLRANELIYTKPVEQFFDPVKGMFLPDRYIKGECPRCGAKDQYGDSCEVCGAVYAPTELKHPFSVLSGARPERRTSNTISSSCPTRAASSSCANGRKADGCRPRSPTRPGNGSRAATRPSRGPVMQRSAAGPTSSRLGFP